jgi:hypothetical protein
VSFLDAPTDAIDVEWKKRERERERSQYRARVWASA